MVAYRLLREAECRCSYRVLGDEEPISHTVACVLSTRDRFGGGDISSIYGVLRVPGVDSSRG